MPGRGPGEPYAPRDPPPPPIPGPRPGGGFRCAPAQPEAEGQPLVKDFSS